MANDNTKLQYIVELLTKGDTRAATDELKKLGAAGESAGKGMASAKEHAMQLFAFLGGTALLKDALDGFLEAERGMNALNAALAQTGQTAPEVLQEVLALAEALGGDLKRDADEVVKVMTQLITFGANTRDLKRLTEAVFDLSEVMGRDVGRAARGMSQALKGNFEVFQQLGIEVDKNKSATEGFNEAFDKLSAMIEGRARKAVQGVAGDVAELSVMLEDAKEQLGGWAAAVLSAAASLGANLGKLASRPEMETAITRQKEAYNALADAIAKAILEAERLGKITKGQAAQMFGRLGGAREILRGGLTDFGQTTSDEDIDAILTQRLPQAGGLLRDLQNRLNLPRTKAGPASTPETPTITTDGLDQKDEEYWFEQRIAMEDQFIAKLNEEALQRERNGDLEAKRSLDALESYRASEQMKQDLAMQTVLTQLDGERRVAAEIEFNHIKRMDQIREMKFETEEQYIEAMNAEEQLYDAQKKRFAQESSLTFKLGQDMKQVAASAEQAFASGLAGAIVSAFEEGDKAFQKFAANFFRQIADMILQALILRAVQGIAGSIFGGGGGGVSGGVSGSGAAYAGYAADGGQFVNKFADGGIAELSSATYFPRFNAIAGEAGREVMTVLSRPRFERINGVPAQVGYAQGNRLAITSADALAKSGGGLGGMIVVEVRYSKDTEARVIENSVKNARVKVVEDMSNDTPLSRVTRQKMA